MSNGKFTILQLLWNFTLIIKYVDHNSCVVLVYCYNDFTVQNVPFFVGLYFKAVNKLKSRKCLCYLHENAKTGIYVPKMCASSDLIYVV